MRILHLPAYFQPEQAASSYLMDGMYQAFTAGGMDMLVYTPVPTRGVSEEVIKEYRNKLHEQLYGGKMDVYRLRLMKEGKNALLRAFRYFISCLKQFWKGAFSKDARTCDVLFVFSTPPIQGAMAGIVKKFNKMPLVYNLQDIFPDSLVGAGLAKRNGFLWKIGRMVENFTYRNADKIIVISEDFKKNIMAKGVPEDKIEVIYNWVDESSVIEVPRAENKLFDKYSLDRDKFYVTYCGNIGLSQNMDMLLEVAKALESNENIHFVLVGNGAYLEQVKQIINDKNVQNVTLLPFQPYEDISHVFSLGDVGLVISKPGIGAASVPSKTWSILSASRPVLANFDENELRNIIENNKCGIFTKAGDKVAFTDAILKLYSDKELCKEMGMKGRQFILNNLTREIGTQKYVNVIKQIVNHNKLHKS